MKLEDILDSKPIRERAQDLLKGMADEEILQWKGHPITQYFRLIWTADYLDYHAGWESGDFTAESDSGTAQKNSKTLGAIEVLSRIVGDLEELTPDDKDTGIPSAG